MKINFKCGKVIGDTADADKIKASIKACLADPLVFTTPEDGVVNVTVFSGDPPFCTIMGAVGDSTGKILFEFSFPDGENIKITQRA